MTNGGAALTGSAADEATDASAAARNILRSIAFARDMGRERSMSCTPRSVLVSIGIGAIIGAVALSGAAATTNAGLPKGTVVVARSTPTNVLIWDASPAVGDLVVARQSGDVAMRSLTADALAIMIARAPRSRARRLEVRVQFVALGVAGAAYDAATFADATPLLIVAADRSAIIAHARTWQRELASDRTPSGLFVHVTGTFPKSR
jgi:hypothetical protein